MRIGKTLLFAACVVTLVGAMAVTAGASSTTTSRSSKHGRGGVLLSMHRQRYWGASNSVLD